MNLSRRDVALAAALAISILVGASLRVQPGVVGVIDDDAVYSVTAKSLAEGRGYRLINLPGAPRQTKYPILYPAIISLAWNLGGHGSASSSQGSGSSSEGSGSSSEGSGSSSQGSGSSSQGSGSSSQGSASSSEASRSDASAGAADGSASAASLAPVERNIFAMQATTMAIAAFAVALAYLFLVRFAIAGRAAAFAACALMAVSPNVLFYCCQTVSELPFLMLMIAAFWAVESRLGAAEHESSAARDVATGVLLGLPFLCRTAGIVFPLTAIALLAYRRKPFVGVAAGALAVTVPWIAWMLVGASAESDKIIGYQTDYLGWWRTNASLAVPLANIRKAFSSFLHIDFEYLSRAAYNTIPRASWLLAALGSLPWIVVAARSRSLGFVPVAMLVYLALLIAWPWPPDRFIVPLLPLLAAMLFDVIWQFASRERFARLAKPLVAAAFAAIVASNAWMLSTYVAASRTACYPYFIWPGVPVVWHNYRIAFGWLRQHTAPGDVIAAGFDTMTSLYTDRPAIRPFDQRPLALFYGVGGSPVGDVAELEKYLAGYRAKYLLLAPMPAYDLEEPFYNLVYAATDERPGLLRPVWQLPSDPRFTIYEVRAPANVPG